MQPWPHQVYAISETLTALGRGERRILLSSPTGGGKSFMVCEIIARLIPEGWAAVVYSNRRLLGDQLVSVLSAYGIEVGIRAAGQPRNTDRDVQVSSIQTERSRTLKAGKWVPHGEGRRCLVVIDEAHLNSTGSAVEIIDWHLSRGHVILGVTATPLGLGRVYNCLIVAGTNSELRACGALVLAHHYGPDEPDLKTLKSAKEKQKRMAPARIFGRVLESFNKLNPDRRPTILFAPGVAESLGFAQEFVKAGISAAHIDGESVWLNGEFHRRVPGDDDPAKLLLEGSREGRICVLCNRFVLREGIDAPWLSHGILATTFDSLQSYLQSGGRLLRAHPGLEGVTIQDHGGNWWRFGSLNADREWHLDCTDAIAQRLRQERLRYKNCQKCKARLVVGQTMCKACGFRNEIEPFLCPVCSQVLCGFKCRCGWLVPPRYRPSRAVIQLDGSLKQMSGDIYRPRRTLSHPDAAKQWACLVLYRAPKAGHTFAKCEVLFAKENNWCYPSRDLPLMPLCPIDWYRKVTDVPVERLRPRRHTCCR